MARSMEYNSEELDKSIEYLLTDSETDTESQTSNFTTMTQRSEVRADIPPNAFGSQSPGRCSCEQNITPNNHTEDKAINKTVILLITIGMLFFGVFWQIGSIYVFEANRDDFRNQSVFEVKDLKSALNPKNIRVPVIEPKTQTESKSDTNYTEGITTEPITTQPITTESNSSNTNWTIVVIVLIGIVVVVLLYKKNNSIEASEVMSQRSDTRADIPPTASGSQSPGKPTDVILPEENIACSRFNAVVLKGENPNALLNGDLRESAYHYIDMERTKEIVIKLGKNYVINHMKMLLWSEDYIPGMDLTSHSYYIEVSKDSKQWNQLVDYTSYLCRSWQWLYFTAQEFQYIRIVGTRNGTTNGCAFFVVSFECMFTNREVENKWGLVIPKDNVASIESNACVIEGLNGETLINGSYDSCGNTFHEIANDSTGIVVQLCQPFLIDSMRLLLWDKDDRKYSYYVEVSVDQQNWNIVADKREELCSSWQVLTFTPTPVVFVRITGTHCSADTYFNCVHFECPQQKY